MSTNNKTWGGDKEHFWAQRDARLQKMDEEASEPPIEVLPTHTDKNGIKWQLPHDSGDALKCFYALMRGARMKVTTKHPSKYKMERGQMVACEWEYQTTVIFKKYYHWQFSVTKGNDPYADPLVTYYPATETHRVFVMAVGFAYDFSGVVLC